MKLTKEEEMMLDGRYGEGTKICMELLVALGEIYGAQDMVSINSAHLIGRTKYSGDESVDWLQELVDGGAYFRVHTTVNPGSVDYDQWKLMCIPERLLEFEKRVDECYRKLGAIPICSCLPYLLGNFMKKGDHFAWAGSAGATFANSVIGARGNREGGISTIAAAITGRTPNYGLHITENRYGKVLVDLSKLDFSKITNTDLTCVGFYIGKELVDKTPVLKGVPQNLSLEQIRSIIAPMPTGGAISMVHIIGVTPEAPTEKAAFGEKNPEDVLKMTGKESQEIYDLLSTAKDPKVDIVALGCPHCTYREIKEVAQKIKGKKVHDDTLLWIFTANQIKNIAEKMGIVDIIEEAGGRFISNTCAAPGATFEYIKGARIVATNSARGAFFIPGACNVEVWLGNTDDCLSAAISGRWGR